LANWPVRNRVVGQDGDDGLLDRALGVGPQQVQHQAHVGVLLRELAQQVVVGPNLEDVLGQALHGPSTASRIKSGPAWAAGFHVNVLARRRRTVRGAPARPCRKGF
jgi:hypothetical protein